MHGVEREIHHYAFPDPACRRSSIMAGALERRRDRFTLEVDRNKMNVPLRRRQLANTRALVVLGSRMIDFEDLYAGQLGHAPCAAVVTGTEQDELCSTIANGGADRLIDRNSAQCD